MKNFHIFGAVTALFLSLSMSAKVMPKPDYSILLYPAGQNVDQGIIENGEQVTKGPGCSNGLTGEVSINAYGEYTNVGDQARLDIYLPEKSNGQMIIDCPGGGYAFTSMTNEGINVADWCLQHDIACCVVSYRIPKGHPTIPLIDVQNAFRYCRAHAAEWGIKQIGVIGFSAGGHLAGCVNTMYEDKVTRPDFAVLIYPVITFDTTVTHPGSMKNLIGKDPTQEQIEFWSVENHITADTPQTFLALSNDDSCVPPENAIRYYMCLQRVHVPCELHIYRSGNHGWGFSTVENSGRDNLGRARSDLFASLSRWLADLRAEIR